MVINSIRSLFEISLRCKVVWKPQERIKQSRENKNIFLIIHFVRIEISGVNRKVVSSRRDELLSPGWCQVRSKPSDLLFGQSLGDREKGRKCRRFRLSLSNYSLSPMTSACTRPSAPVVVPVVAVRSAHTSTSSVTFLNVANEFRWALSLFAAVFWHGPARCYLGLGKISSRPLNTSAPLPSRDSRKGRGLLARKTTVEIRREPCASNPFKSHGDDSFGL